MTKSDLIMALGCLALATISLAAVNMIGVVGAFGAIGFLAAQVYFLTR